MVRRLILTAAQNNTPVHAGAWRALLALRDHLGADLWVSSLTYNTGAYGRKSVKRGKAERIDVVRWADEVVPFLRDEQVEVAPGLVWHGNTNEMITKSSPLSTWASYKGRKSGIFPHPRLALESGGVAGGRAVKFNYTTGVVTIPHYIQKGPGQRAEDLHSLGGLVVEIGDDGRWFVRQLVFRRGVIQDLDVVATAGGDVRHRRVEAITWGDLHVPHVDPRVAEASWGEGPGSMLSVLRPREQHVHDVIDFYARNHHDVDNPRLMFRRFALGLSSIEDEIAKAAAVLRQMARASKVYVVDSNHDRALTRWLDGRDRRFDAANALFWLKANAAAFEAEAGGYGREFGVLAHAMKKVSKLPGRVVFLPEDASHRVGDVEVALHGDRGENGARGTTRGLARLGDRVTSAHTHSAEIRDGLYCVGTSSRLDLDYVHGPSSWSHSHVVTYPNGARAIVTLHPPREGEPLRWRAE